MFTHSGKIENVRFSFWSLFSGPSSLSLGLTKTKLPTAFFVRLPSRIYVLVGRLDGWLGGWLAGWLVGWGNHKCACLFCHELLWEGKGQGGRIFERITDASKWTKSTATCLPRSYPKFTPRAELSDWLTSPPGRKASSDLKIPPPRAIAQKRRIHPPGQNFRFHPPSIIMTSRVHKLLWMVNIQ